MRLSRSVAALFAGSALVCASEAAQSPAGASSGAQGYPARGIRFIVPFPPGGGNDVVGRIVAGQLQQLLGQPVVIDNRGGAGGTEGTNIAAKSAPDGQTLLINNISLAVNPTLFARLPFDTERDLAPISIIGRQPSVLAVSPGLPVKSVGELLDLARKTPGRLIYGSGGPGTSSHLATAWLELLTKVSMTHVPYRGLAPAITDLANGKVEMIIATASTALPQLKAGRIRALAVTTPRRSTQFPQLPTVIEAGVPGFEVSTWYALLVPAATPAAIVTRLNGEAAKIAKSADGKALFSEQGMETEHTTPKQARAYIGSEIDKWGKVVKAAAIKPN